MTEHVEKYKTRHIRMDEEAYQALKAAAKSTGHGSINRLVRAMFVPPPDDPLAEVRAREEAAESKTFAAFEEKRAVVYGDGSGHLEVLEALAASRMFNKDEVTTIRVHGDIKDLKYEPVNE